MKNTEEKRRLDLWKMENIEKKKAHIEKSIQNGLKAARDGDEKKLGMVASRRKKLEKRVGMEYAQDVGKYKVSYQGLVNDVVVEREEAPVSWSIPEPEPLRNQASIAEIEDVTFGYSANKNILQNLTMNIEMGDKIAIVGANGGGKSTLVNILIGHLKPQKGTVQHHPSCKIGFFTQHQITDLPPRSSALQLMKERYPDLEEKEIRSFLGSFGIGSYATSPVGTLSGGMRVRVAFALEVYGGKNLLVLDEPTNHLDMQTIIALCEALKEFKGAVVVVSHDQSFVKEFAKKTITVNNGKVEVLEGGIDQYVKRIGKNIEL
ncbi:hypothetical protein HDV05_006926 [Chytridiales sp. JEL 0842]|nr:hypothetical protein HDV05_006926 [Chytridiales sp. JEL 0842]